jgi:tRNA nucleotidyltransferase/poly(A) polymerase
MKFFEVGGCVRDELLGVKSKDIDFTVVLEDFDFRNMQSWGVSDPFAYMEDRLGRKYGFEIFLPTPEFLTIRAKFPKGHKHSCLTADFVLARKESDYTDGRRPDKVEPGTLEDDLRRRDFTMNALAKDDRGIIIDLFGGQQDIKNKVIRTVGSPYQRFEEDALRIVRAMRFSVTKKFWIERETRDAMEDTLSTVAGVSAERVREELTKMFNADPLDTIITLNSFPSLIPIIFDMGINFQPTMKQRLR